METRTIKIIDNKTQSQYTISSKAADLGELKKELRDNGVDYDGMTFYCGELRAELKDDAAPLPKEVEWKGQTKTSLTFLLTQPDKKVASGAYTRSQAYDYIKSHNLQDKVLHMFGKNYTTCTTADLVKAIEDSKTSVTCTTCACKCNVEEAFRQLMDVLLDDEYLDSADYESIMNTLKGCSSPKSEDLSQQEIDEMFKGWAK